MGILEPKKKIVLLNYPLGLSLLKYRNVWVFWNKKKSGSNRCSPLNSSIKKKNIRENCGGGRNVVRKKNEILNLAKI